MYAVSEDFEVVEERPGEHKISLLADGEKVSRLTVLDLRMHYGKSEVTVGGIAGVFTSRAFRRKGYSKKIMEYAIRWMQSKEYSLSALFGIRGYYERYGFAVFMSECTVTLPLKNIAKIKPSVKHQITLSDNPKYKFKEIARLYEENNIYRVASIVRNLKSWKGFRKGVSWEHEPKILVARDDDVLGYAALERWPPLESTIVAEIEARKHDYRVYASLLNKLYEIMRRKMKSYLKLYVPSDHPIINILSAYGCTLRIDYPASGGGMACVVSLKRTLRTIKDELEARSKGVEGDVCICLPDGRIKLKEGAGTRNKVKMGWGAAAQLILGYRRPDEITSSAETHGNVAILEKLFPRTTPYVWQPDRW